MAWIVDYVRTIRALDRGRMVVSLWPVLGYWDRLLLSTLAGRSALVMHDPEPLVAATGYGAAALPLVGGVPHGRGERAKRVFSVAADVWGPGRENSESGPFIGGDPPHPYSVIL